MGVTPSILKKAGKRTNSLSVGAKLGTRNEGFVRAWRGDIARGKSKNTWDADFTKASITSMKRYAHPIFKPIIPVLFSLACTTALSTVTFVDSIEKWNQTIFAHVLYSSSTDRVDTLRSVGKQSRILIKRPRTQS